MNAGQQQFYNFVMARVKEDKAEEAKAMMLENFKRQDEGTFTREYMQQNAPRLMSYIKKCGCLTADGRGVAYSDTAAG